MNLAYPTTVAAIPGWAADNGIGIVETRRRFAQYEVLRGIARSDELRGVLVFKGGNALDFVYRPSRSTVDLDFSADMDLLSDRMDVDRLRTLPAESIESTEGDLGLLLRVQRVEQQPPGTGRTFVTYHATIGYALLHEVRLHRRMRNGEASPTIVPVDVSLNEPICASRIVEIDDGCSLRVSDIDDIVAEKLRALLQQPLRNRRRPQDLLDIVTILRDGPPLDPQRVAPFLLEKAAARNVPVTRRAFRDPAVAERARQGYEELRVTTRSAFIPFDAALIMLVAFIDRLSIPD